MPRGDRTGPAGSGPMTGRGMGWCARPGGNWHGDVDRVAGFGWGRARGWRHCHYASGIPGWARHGPGSSWAGPPAPGDWTPGSDALGSLKDYAAGLERELSGIRTRISELEKTQPDS